MKSKSNLKAIIFVLSALLLSSILTGCSSGGGGGETQTVSIPETTKVANDETIQQLSSVEEDKLIFDGETDLLNSLKSGDVIVFPSTDKTPDGLLLKVVSVEKVNGKTEVHIEPASLTDAIENADIQQSIDLTVDDIEEIETVHEDVETGQPVVESFQITPQAAGTNFSFKARVKAHRSLTVLTTTNFSLGYSLRIKIGFFKLKYFEAKAKASEKAGVDLIATTSLKTNSKIKIARIKFRPFTIWISYVPVVVRPVIVLYGGADADFNVKGTAGVDQSLSYEVGIKYDSSGFSPISNYERSFTAKGPSLDKGRITSKGYLRPELVIFIYGIPGPFFGLEGYLKLLADANSDPWCHLYGGIASDVGARLSKISRSLGNIKYNLFDFSLEIYKCKSPQMIVSPASISGFSGKEGGPFNPIPTSVTYQISSDIPSSKGGDINWSVSTDAQWLDISQSNGKASKDNPLSVVVSLNSKANQLKKGKYTAEIDFTNTTNDRGNTKRYIILNVRQPSMFVQPGPDLFFLGSGYEGKDFSKVGTVSFSIGVDEESIDWRVENIPDWLNVNPSEGTVSDGNPVTVSVSIDQSKAQTLPVGSHSADLLFKNITNGKGDTVRKVTLQVLINVEPDETFEVSIPEGGPASASKTYRVMAVNDDVNWKSESDADWIKLSKTSGTAKRGGTSDIVVSIDEDKVKDFKRGTYRGKVFFESQESGDFTDRQFTDVVLNVVEPIEITPDTLSFSGKEGGPFSPGSSKFSVKMPSIEPPQDISFEVSTDVNWLDINPETGTLTEQEPERDINISVNQNANSLPEGTYTANVTFKKVSGMEKSVTKKVVLNISNIQPCSDEFNSGSQSAFVVVEFNPVTGQCNIYDINEEDGTVGPAFHSYTYPLQEGQESNTGIFIVGWEKTTFLSVEPALDYSPEENTYSIPENTDIVITLKHEGYFGGPYCSSGVFRVDRGASVTVRMIDWRKVDCPQ